MMEHGEEIARGARVLVTGAAGGVGSHVVRALLAAGYAGRATDKVVLREAARRLEEEGADGAVEWVRADLTRAGEAERLVAGCAAIIHAAVKEQGDAPLPFILVHGPISLAGDPPANIRRASHGVAELTRRAALLDDAASWFKLGVLAAGYLDDATALRAFEAAIERDPTHPRAHAERVACLRRTGASAPLAAALPGASENLPAKLQAAGGTLPAEAAKAGAAQP
jgi:NAD(P)-dependent dehydrogenase (short-subunit alcohol dehydrogenase family)